MLAYPQKDARRPTNQSRMVCESSEIQSETFSSKETHDRYWKRFGYQLTWCSHGRKLDRSARL